MAGGCQASKAEPWLSSNPAPITMGMPDDGDLGVVALVRERVLVCTGTLISPRVVATAAHCFEGASAALPKVFFGSDISADGNLLGVLDVRNHPGFDRVTRRNDLAALLLETPAPPEAVPWPLQESGLAVSDLGSSLRLVGFGSTGGDKPKFGRKHMGVTTLAELEDETFVHGPNPSQTCVGDSGGPAFLSIGGVERLAGITSSGDPECAGFGRSVRVDLHAASFFLAYVEATLEGTAAVGQRCYYDAQCTSGLCVLADDDPRIRYCSNACRDDVDCHAGMNCYPAADGERLCRYRPPTPGTQGSSCIANHQCITGLCASDAPSIPSMCTVPCFPENTPACPEASYECRATAADLELFACFPVVDAETEQGCALTGRRATAPWLMLIVVALVHWKRFKRRSQFRDRPNV